MVITRTLSAFLIRDWRTARSYRVAWILGFAESLFQLVIFHYMSRLIDVPAFVVAPGHTVDYFPFVVIGLALNNFLVTGIGVFSSSLRMEQTSGTLEMLLSLPVSRSVTLFGMGTYSLGWSLLTTIFLMSSAIVFFGLRLVMNPFALFAAAVTLLASVTLFASLGVVISAFTLVFKRAGSFNSLVIQALGLLSGVFFPIALLPAPLRWLAEIVPFAWALDTLRQTLLAGSVPLARLLVLIMTSAIAVPVALWVFHKALQYARRTGSLGQY